MKTNKIIIAGIGPHTAFVPPPHPLVQEEIIIVHHQESTVSEVAANVPIGYVQYHPISIDNSKNYINGKQLPRKKKIK